MSMTPPPVYDLRSAQPPSRTLKPYLELPHLLSLTWLAYPILSLLFVAFRLQLSSASASDATASAKQELLASCKAAEKAATAAASMPRYMAAATNVRITDAVNGTMNGARAALVLALTIMEVIINFIVDTYRSTFLCFLELVVRGGLSILISAVKELNSFIENTLNGLRTNIQNDVAAANKVIQGAVSALNKVNPFGDISVPQFSIPSLDALQNVTLPTDFEDALVKLNSSLPTLSELKDKVESIIDTPFELVKKDINETFSGLSFDVNALPVPAQNTVQFCDQMDTSIVDDLGRDLVKIAKIGTIILILVAFLLIGANCFLEWYKWRCMKNHLRWTREAWTTDPSLHHVDTRPAGVPTMQLNDHNLLMLHGNMLHPMLTKMANRISAFLRLSPSQHVNVSWFFHYVFHPPAFACFLIGFLGFLSVEIQLLAVSPLAHKYSEQAVASTNDFSNTIATSINDTMYNQSAAYANDINSRVDHVQSTINDGLFGWVNGTTSTLNDTINAFYTDLQDAVSTVFNGTILESPVQEFIRCFIGSKVDAIESALTFLHNNLVVNIPRVNDTVLVLSPDDVNEATRPIATAALGSGNGDDQGVVGKLINAYIATLKKERIMFSIFLALWGFVVLMALCVIFWYSHGRPTLHAYRRRRWRKQNRVGVESFIVPYRQQAPNSSASSVDKPHTHVSLIPPRNDAILIAELHPLDTRNPTYGKSWESILDNVPEPTPERRSPLRISPPRKLMALGSSRKEGQSPASSSNSATPIWMKPFSSAFWRTKSDSPTPRVDLGSDTGSIRSRPQLTVTTSIGSNKPSVEEKAPAEPELNPTIAWSVSPSKPSWLSNVVPPPLRHKHRRTTSVPDVRPIPNAIPVLAPNETHFAVPLHHGWTGPDASVSRPPPPPPSLELPGYPTYMPPYHLTLESSSDARPTLPPRRTKTDPDAMPLPGRSLAGHTRHASNPFATPFDDIHEERRSSMRQSSPTNPFIGVAF